MYTQTMSVSFHSIKQEVIMKDIEKQLTISSIKLQKFNKILPLQEAFMKGTIYVDLYKPFAPRRRGMAYEK